jgi:hypothetical protein
VATSYELVHASRSGHERVHPYTSERPLAPGSVVHYEGRDWLVESVEGGRVMLKPARYRLRLHHPDGTDELGAFRRFRADAPRAGHTLSTVEDGEPVSWQVVDERLARDDQGEPYLELVAERDFSERDNAPTLPEHELEHALVREENAASAAEATLARAEEAGQFVELVALEPGEAPDWAEAERYLDAIGLEPINDDLLVRCGVDPDRDSRDGWMDTVRERLRADLESFRADVEDNHDEIDEWDFREGRVFAAVGSFDSESDPLSPHGWMGRLYDAGVLGAAGFTRVRKADVVI